MGVELELRALPSGLSTSKSYQTERSSEEDLNEVHGKNHYRRANRHHNLSGSN
jgi:hypothetical protein